MNTEYVVIDNDNIDEDVICRAGKIIKAGGLVAFPTETVYGLGGDALNPEASAKIYSAKGRPSDNPLIVHIADIAALGKITENVPEAAYRLADKFWPGPLTMIFNKSDIVPHETTGGLNTVAVRMPSNKTALAFIKASGGYIAAPSANVSGRPSPTLGSHVLEDMDGRIEMILDGGECIIGLESTIVDLTEDTPMILRPGYVSIEMVREVLGSAEYDPAIVSGLDAHTAPKAPGMKYKHYAPKGDLTIVSGQRDAVVGYIKGKIKESEGCLKVGILATTETCPLYSADKVVDIGSLKNEDEVARHLYSALRDFDEEGIDLIYSEEFNFGQIGQAIMNRLIKAAGHKIVEV